MNSEWQWTVEEGAAIGGDEEDMIEVDTAGEDMALEEVDPIENDFSQGAFLEIGIL
jgi:hypothetical protein